ncbi:MAG TPA: Holliday junction resolvase RuvX [Candidatus Acidoferrales bacterium]|jgi:putative Holliday junction resolvase|nr:Holliday junction resolvase RuvX [Candidatus Acidoferrales bacterium]
MAAANPETSGNRRTDAPARERRRILGLDYGRKRIGLAISDELRLTAQPLQTLTRKNRAEDVRRLRQICREQGVARIIVGHPVHITGEPGEMAEEAARFAARLRKELGVEVELLDERLTSWEAEQTVAQTRPARGRDRAPVDDVAAAILLREYLERQPPARGAITEKV